VSSPATEYDTAAYFCGRCGAFESVRKDVRSKCGTRREG
jgi:hypothetical protein